MRIPRALLCTMASVACLATPASALAAKWTVASILVGEYAEMERRMRTTGSSDDVNVVMLHYKGQGNAVAYKLLKDANSSHPAGQCCPEGGTSCCGVENIALSSIGINSSLSASAVKKFYQYVVQNYPADHYMIVLRGEPDYTRVLAGEFTQGITIIELNSALKAVVDARGGKKVEVLVVGFCESGVLDWAYGVSQTVDYYVGTPQFTNPPVAMRWRIYRWARALIEKPSTSSRELASKVVDLFAMSDPECNNSNGCSNAPEEPWTCVAVETAKLPAVAAAVKDVACAVLPSVTSSMHKSVLQATTRYCSNWTPRYDMAGYFMNLKAKVSDSAAKAAIDRVIAAHDASIVAWKYEPGYFNDKAYGYSFYVDKDLGSVSEIGNWQIDSLWQAYAAKAGGSTSALPSATGLVIDPAEVSLNPGDPASLTARGVSSKYPSMCALSSVTWSTDSLQGIATLDNASANPVVITGRQAGTGTLKASASGYSAQAEVKVAGEVIPDQDAGGYPDAGSSDAGLVHPDAGKVDPSDAGPVRPDAGPARIDAGPSRPDADPVNPDAGSVPRDAGSQPVRSDAGGEDRGGSGGGQRPDINPFAGCGNGAAIVVFLPPLFGARLKRRRRSVR
jgi:hypothetical protein